MATILITNDDGITSPGIIALEEAMQQLGTTVVVAPSCNNSGVSNAISINKPLRLEKHGKNRYSVDGTPTDCVILALHKILSESPALVVSGINLGPNLGDDLHYSGTVAAAKEASLQGIPAISFSSGDRENLDFSVILADIRQIAKQVITTPLPPQSLLNVNFPQEKRHKGIRLTCQGRRRWLDAIFDSQEANGNLYYKISGGTPRGETIEESDVQAFNAGYVSVTPIQLDFTNHQLFNEWKEARIRFV